MSLEMILVYGFMFLFSIGVIGFILYSAIVIIIEIIKNRKMDKEILNSMSTSEHRYHRFLKRIWK